jgi:hypothetical protein
MALAEESSGARAKLLHNATDKLMATVEPMKRLILSWLDLATGLQVPISASTLFGSRANGHHLPQRDVDLVLQFPPVSEAKQNGLLLGANLCKWMRNADACLAGVTHTTDAMAGKSTVEFDIRGLRVGLNFHHSPLGHHGPSVGTNDIVEHVPSLT